MARKTAAQLAEDARLVAAMEAELTDGEGEDVVKQATLTVMLGQGESVQIGVKTYDMAPFPLVHLKRAYELLNACPPILTAQALAARDGEPIPLDRLTAVFNGLTGRGEEEGADKEEYTEEGVAYFLVNLPQIMAGEEQSFNPMYEVMLLALRRRSPEITRADIEAEMDIPTFISWLRKIMRVNTGMRENF